MKRILVTYATMAGSTAEVAQVIAEEISVDDVQVDVLPLNDVQNVEDYDAVVVGAPMILGWHRAALRFLRQNRTAFQRIPFAVFVLAMSLTQTNESSVDSVPVYVDEKLPKLPQRANNLTFKEHYARLSNYLRPIIKASQPSKLKSIAVFGGRMEYGRLKWWAVLFAMVIIQAPAGDKRNWDAIRSWAKSLPVLFQLEASKTPQQAI